MAKQKRQSILTRLDIDQGSLDNLIDYLNDLKKKHGEKFDTLNILEDYYGDGGYTYDLIGIRLETDQEEQDRLAVEEANNKRFLANNRREYERLKKIFEPDNK